VRQTTLPPSCHEIWELKLPGTLWATRGLLRDSFIFTFTFTCILLDRINVVKVGILIWLMVYKKIYYLKEGKLVT
jgi:hypothetical protein